MTSIGDKLGQVWLQLEAEGHELASKVKEIVNELLGHEKTVVLDAEADAKQLLTDGEAAAAPVIAEVEDDAKQVFSDVKTAEEPVVQEAKADAAGLEAEVVSGMSTSDVSPATVDPEPQPVAEDGTPIPAPSATPEA